MTAVSATKTVSPESIGRQNLHEKIDVLRKKHNAIILAHYYQDPEVQDIADFVGDSLELSRRAKNTNADVIVFCGVHFMAETAKILSPEKKVLIPDMDAGCTLADDCPADEFEAFCARHPDHYVVSYINCSAAVKAQSDLICTSSNAVELINQLPADKPILFAPDMNLGKWVSRQSGRKLTFWPGSCVVHESFSEEVLIKLKLKYPDAEVIAHPECQENLLELSDFVGSTSKLLNRTKESNSARFIVLTEPGILHKMRNELPTKEYIEMPGLDGCSCNSCPYMRLNTLEKIYSCLSSKSPEIIINTDLLERAFLPMDLMLKMSN